MATIRNKVVVDSNFHHFSGVFAWFVWMFAHPISPQ
jgi:NADH dehydrogenase